MKLNFCPLATVSFWLAQVVSSLTWRLQWPDRLFIHRWHGEPEELSPAENYTRQWYIWKLGTATVSRATVVSDLIPYTNLLSYEFKIVFCPSVEHNFLPCTHIYRQAHVHRCMHICIWERFPCTLGNQQILFSCYTDVHCSLTLLSKVDFKN